jgi:hypothetical protein
MLVKKVTYTDYKGVKREEELYFNLSKAEVAEMELSHDGGLSEHIKKIVSAQSGKDIITLFKDLIIKSYGVISDDGKRFIKNDKLREEFVQTEAYSDLFMELASDADAASAFVNGIIPQVENKVETKK